MIENKIVLVTGGTGSWGNELAKQLLELNVKEIRIFSRGEFAQVTMQRKFNDNRLKFIIGDVRDFDSINSACKNVDIIFHLAALKHIPVCEIYPDEAIKTNIIGTRNVIYAAIKNRVKKVIDVSTDKACDPLNLYGMTKAVGEKLILHANTIRYQTEFLIVRGGNVLGSNGSVVPHFINQIKNGKDLEITDFNMTRYFLTLPEAIKLLFTAVFSGRSNGIFVMKMPAFKIKEIAEVLIEEFNSNSKIVEVGIRQGEKLHEVLVSKYESRNTYEYDENYYLIKPNGENELLDKVKFEEYTSNTVIYGKYDIRKLLRNGGYL